MRHSPPARAIAVLLTLGVAQAAPPPAATASPEAALGPWLDVRQVRVGKGRIAWGEGAGASALELVEPLSIALDGPRPKVVAKLRARRLTPPPTAARAGDGGARGTADGRVFSSAPLPVDSLRLLDAEVGLDADRLELGGAIVERLSLEAKLEGGELTVAPLRFGLAGGETAGMLRARPENGTLAVSLKSETKGLALGILMAQLGQRDLIEAPAEVEIDLASRGGASVAGLMAALEGEVGVYVDEGRAVAGTIDRLVGGVGRIGAALVGIGAGEWAKLECAVLDLKIRNGLVTPTVAVANTANTVVTVEGLVDLGKERFDLTFLPRPKTVALLSLAVPVRLVGPLAAPGFEMNAVSAGLNIATELARLAVAIAFPPSLIADLAGLGDAKGCLDEAAKDSSLLGKALGLPGEAAKGVLEGVGKGLGGLLGR